MLPTFSSFLYSLLTFCFGADIKLLINYVIVSFANTDTEKSSKTRDSKLDKRRLLDINTADVKMVMGRLGIEWELQGNETSIGYGEELLGMFDDDKEIRVDEVKEAFDVFDQNRDGFIDVMELQRVLYVLGFKEWDENSCRKMIDVFDLNGDGVIDFQEFLIFMEDYCFS